MSTETLIEGWGLGKRDGDGFAVEGDGFAIEGWDL